MKEFQEFQFLQVISVTGIWMTFLLTKIIPIHLLSEHGKLHLPNNKSDLLSCFEAVALKPSKSYDAKVIEGPSVYHFLPTSAVTTSTSTVMMSFCHGS